MSIPLKVKIKKCVLYSAVLVSLSQTAAAAEAPINLKPTTTLSAAANAANSAVTAAAAASTAAAAAANAAAAAVEAINAILPPSQRIIPARSNSLAPLATIPLSTQTLSAAQNADGVVITPLEPLAATLNKNLPLLDLAKGSEENASNAMFASGFAIPREHSLLGLVGTFEVAVSADERGEFAAGIANIEAERSEPVELVSAMDLAQAVKVSLGFSRDVLIANARVDQAKAQTGQARAFLLPSLLLNMKAGRETSAPGVRIDPATSKAVTSSNHYRSDQSLMLRQPLVDVASFYDWKRRGVLEKSREEGVRSSQGDSYLATVNAYLALISSRVQANMALDYEAQMKQLFIYIEKRALAGAASNSDKERVRARTLNAQSSRIEQEAAQAAAGVEFVRLVNIAPATLRLPEMEDMGITVVPAALTEAMPLAIESNPDIAVLRQELSAAGIDRNVAKARLLPKLDLELSDTVSSHVAGALGEQHDKRMMVVMNWSMFNGGSDLKLNDEKAARYSELSYRLDDQRRRVLQALTAQYATLEAARKRIDTGYSELDSISTAAKAMSNRMISGNQSLLDMLDVYDRYYQARTRLVTLHIQEMSSVAQIARLVQGAPRSDLLATDVESKNSATGAN